MKAVDCNDRGGVDVLQVSDVRTPGLEDSSVLIRVTHAALNRADLLQRRGLYPPPPGAPTTLGLECAGVVESVGPAVDDVEPGSRAMALVAGGGQAELAAVHRGSVLAVPSALDDIEAGAFPEVFLTAYLNLFMLGRLEAGSTALVHGGSGGVGTAAIQLVREAGAAVIVTAGSNDRCRQCLELGADHAINYREADFAAVVPDLTGGAGVDVVLDCVGGRYLGDHLRVLHADGSLVIIGLMGGVRGELDLGRLLRKRLRVIGSTLRALSDDRKAKIVSSFRERFGEALEAGRLRPVIDSVYPMEAVADAHERLESGAAFGKVVLSIP